MRVIMDHNESHGLQWKSSVTNQTKLYSHRYFTEIIEETYSPCVSRPLIENVTS